MSDDWKPGDLALCVNARHPFGRDGGVREGAVYTVDDVWGVGSCLTFGRTLGLVIRGVCSPAPSGAFAADRFRKIKPLTDEEREQFAADLNVREPVSC